MSCHPASSQAKHQSCVDDVYRLFVNRTDAVLLWRNGWRIERCHLTRHLLERALTEPTPLGVMAVSGTGTSRWTCWDSDDDDELPALMTLFDDLPVESRLFETSRRGAHVWHFHHTMPWQQAHQFGKVRAQSARLENIEIFPKHGGLNAVRLPGMVHPRSGVRHPLVDPYSGEILDLAEAIAAIRPSSLGDGAFEPPPSSRSPTQIVTTDHKLIRELGAITSVTEYAPGRASGICPWHDDGHASLFVKGRRFHCFACGVWGDVWDVRRWRLQGKQPPRTGQSSRTRNALRER